MSKAFFKALNIPKADINLGIDSGSRAEQVDNNIIAFKINIIKRKPLNVFWRLS
jgi:UDP-N-acetylglucosamine 2-epimerase (non-hydrolysing)